MTNQPGVTLDDKYTATRGRVLMSGIQALVRTTLDQRRLDAARQQNTAVLVTGYQGSPLGGVDREMAAAKAFLEPEHIMFRQGLNEELAATAVGGSQLINQLDQARFEGVTGIWFGKNPGLDRAADAIRHANISGTAPLGGAVAWIGDDPSSKSSTVPSSAEPMCKSLMMPLLAPGSVAEVSVFGLHAIAMSRYAGLWTGLKIVADVADSTAVVDVEGVLDAIPDLPRRAAKPPPVLLPPTNLDAEHDLMTTRLARALEYASIVGLNRVTFEPKNPRLAIVAAGMGYQAVMRAIADLGLSDLDLNQFGVRLIQIGMPWPLDLATLRSFAQGVETVLVVEDKLPFIESMMKEALFRIADAPAVVGKHENNGRTLLPVRSALTSDSVIDALVRFLPVTRSATTTARTTRTQLALLPTRTPAFCSGCPHSASTRANQDQLVGVGIGCHIMVAIDSEEKRGDLIGMPQMGGEGAQWLGLEPFTDNAHFIQNLGDGTFHHSGSLAIRASVAAGVNMTYRLLINDAVAMTGGQRPLGQLSVPDLTRWLAIEGVRRIIITTANPRLWRRSKLDPIATVCSRDDIETVQRELAQIEGVTVMLHVDRCATEERRLRKRGKAEAPPERVWINERVCEGCGDCSEKSSCLSVHPVQTEFGRKTRIHQSSCNQDFSCVKGDCPSFVMVKPGGRRVLESIPGADLNITEPLMRVGDEVLIRMPGVGGTGVVTVSQVLQMAAHLEGRHAAGLEQIGLAQKGGPVLSDLRLSRKPVVGQLRAALATVDVLIGFDSLGASSDDNLAALTPGRCIAVVNTAEVPTAQMVQNDSVAFPAWADVESRISQLTDSSQNLYIDAQGLAERFFDDHMPANMILIGAAFQHGVLPLRSPMIEKSISLNGAAVQKNLDAFRLGRLAVLRPDLLVTESEPPARHANREHFVAELTAYQNAAYADRFEAQVSAVAQIGADRCGDSAGKVADAFAAGLFKLMAYKDEYEVARLHLNSSERARLVARFGDHARIRIMLHPPLLRWLGWKQKIGFGAWILPVFRALYGLRRLRGTRWDVFGYTEVRRAERSLPTEYAKAVTESLSRLTPANAQLITELCELPDLVRGYEHVKLANVELFRRRLAESSNTLMAMSATPGQTRTHIEDIRT